jgi:hypothetical protein
MKIQRSLSEFLNQRPITKVDGVANFLKTTPSEISKFF